MERSASSSFDPAAPGPRLLAIWRRLHPLPGGRRLFSAVLGRMVPYTGGLGATVLELEPGRAEIELADRRAVRNHLDSVHAVAQLNLGELATGLAMLTGLPPGVRAIVRHLEMDYVKKARGTLRATCAVEIPSIEETIDLPVRGTIRDGAGDVVSTVMAVWRLSPPKASR